MNGAKIMRKKEPIKHKKIWIVLVILYVLSVPWYLPKGTYTPIIFGIPYWGWIVLGVSLAISITLTYVIKKYWHLSDEENEDKED